MNWWEAPEWADKRAMDFGKVPKLGPFRVVRVPADEGEAHRQPPQLRLSIYVGANKAARC